MADFLRGMAVASRRRVAWRSRGVSPAEIRRRAAAAPDAPPLRLSAEGFDVIAEVKRRAPGGDQSTLDEPALATRLAALYADAGAAAVSVLTEPLAFGGSLADLRAASRAAARAARPVPTMRKDFVVDPYQVYEARAEGAGGVLLIAGLVSRDDGRALVEAAAEAGLWVLVEAFTDERTGEAAGLATFARDRGVPALLGVNVRDLRSLAVDRERLARVAPELDRLAPGIPAVAESGVRDGEDAARAAGLGFRLALVGRALARSMDPTATLGEFLTQGRRAAREAPVG